MVPPNRKARKSSTQIVAKIDGIWQLPEGYIAFAEGFLAPENGCWKTIRRPFGAISAQFSGAKLPLVLGRVDLIWKKTVWKPRKNPQIVCTLQKTSQVYSVSCEFCILELLLYWTKQEAMLLGIQYDSVLWVPLWNVLQGWKDLRNFRNFMISVGNPGFKGCPFEGQQFGWVRWTPKSWGSRPVPQFVLLLLEQQAGNLLWKSEVFSCLLLKRITRKYQKQLGTS